jgi:hypothetical protein
LSSNDDDVIEANRAMSQSITQQCLLVAGLMATLTAIMAGLSFVLPPPSRQYSLPTSAIVAPVSKDLAGVRSSVKLQIDPLHEPHAPAPSTAVAANPMAPLTIADPF